MQEYTYDEIATNYKLWSEYVDTSGEMTEEEFSTIPVEQKIAMQVEMFGGIGMQK